jgi:HK97 family phage major capsid protein
VHRSATMRENDPRLFQAAGQGLNEAVPSEGGFMVPKAYGDDIVLRSFGSPILSRVRKQTLTVGNAIELNLVDETSRATGSRHGGVQGYWVDEGTAPSASRPAFARQEWKPRKLAFLGYATDELLADASMVESVMSEAFMLELRFMVENAIFRGTGAGQPKGLLNEGALISVAKESGQAADTLEKENIDKMWARMYAPSRQNAVWLINQDIEPQLDNLTMVIGTGGVPVYLPAGGIGDSPFSRLKGREVIPTEYNPTVGDQGDLMLVDLSQYLLIDKGDPQRATSMHVAFTTDEMAFRVTYRVDGHLRWRSALTPFQGSNTVGPVVVLDARA